MNLLRLEEEIARMKKNQERRLHRKNAKLIKEGGTPMQINRVVKADTTVSLFPLLLSRPLTPFLRAPASMWTLRSSWAHEYVCYFTSRTPFVLIIDAETNRKCPKWAEYNGAAPPSLTSANTSPPQTPTVGNGGGFQQGPDFSANNPGPSSIRAQGQFNFAAAVPSPLATSTPFTASDAADDGESSVPKLKLTLKKS